HTDEPFALRPDVRLPIGELARDVPGVEGRDVAGEDVSRANWRVLCDGHLHALMLVNVPSRSHAPAPEGSRPPHMASGPLALRGAARRRASYPRRWVKPGGSGPVIGGSTPLARAKEGEAMPDVKLGSGQLTGKGGYAARDFKTGNWSSTTSSKC